MAKNGKASKQEENEKEEMGEKQVKKMVFDDSSSLDGRTDGRTDKWTDGRTDGHTLLSRCENACKNRDETQRQYIYALPI